MSQQRLHMYFFSKKKNTQHTHFIHDLHRLVLQHLQLCQLAPCTRLPMVLSMALVHQLQSLVFQVHPTNQMHLFVTNNLLLVHFFSKITKGGGTEHRTKCLSCEFGCQGGRRLYSVSYHRANRHTATEKEMKRRAYVHLSKYKTTTER